MNIEQIKKDMDNSVLLGRETIKWLVEQNLKAKEILNEITENPPTYDRASDHRESCFYCVTNTPAHSEDCLITKANAWLKD